MPEKIFILYHYKDEERERAQRMFLDAGLLDVVVRPELLTGFQKLEVAAEDTLLKLQMAATLHGLPEPGVRRVIEPTAKELRAATLLHMFVWVHHSPDGHPRDGTAYDESQACPGCGAGLRQLSPFRLQKGEVPRGGLLGGVGDEVLVHESLAGELADERWSVRFEEVLDASGGPLPWRQLVVERSMPLMTIGTRGVIRGRVAAERPCTTCGIDGYFDQGEHPFVPAYDPLALETMPAIAWTAERFGTGAWAEPIDGRRRLADRRLIVRQEVCAFFRARRIRGVRFTPLTVG